MAKSNSDRKNPRMETVGEEMRAGRHGNFGEKPWRANDYRDIKVLISTASLHRASQLVFLHMKSGK